MDTASGDGNAATVDSSVAPPARGVVRAASESCLVLTLPGTSYAVHLVPQGFEDGLPAPGAHVAGDIAATALKLHLAAGGGRFIEPVEGAPRIVAGVVAGHDASAGRVYLQGPVPMWITLGNGESVESCPPGQLVNFYVESGATFTPRPAPGSPA